MLPAEVVGLYSALSDNELGQIKQAGQLLDLQAGDEPALRALEEMNAPLHQRVLQARNSIDQKANSNHF